MCEWVASLLKNHEPTVGLIASARAQPASHAQKQSRSVAVGNNVPDVVRAWRWKFIAAFDAVAGRLYYALQRFGYDEVDFSWAWQGFNSSECNAKPC
jgi:hypothetical protein